MGNEDNTLLTFSGHLNILRKIFLRIIGVIASVSLVIFCFKDITFRFLLAPSEWNFVTYRCIEKFFSLLGQDFHFDEFHVDLIATDLSSQFMTHITTSLCLGLLVSSPYILFKLYTFISPALYENERKYSVLAVCLIYLLFIIGFVMSYFVLFPISFRFLGTYSVSTKIHSTITLDSYISTFITLTFLMGLVFQLPLISFVLGKMGFIDSTLLSDYRRHALIIIMLVAAMITPPDIMTLIIVTLPLYLLYEVSIIILRKIERKSQGDS